MIDPVTANTWYFRVLFIVIATAVLFVHLLPLQTTPGNWAAPNILISIVFAWVLRRPEYLPITLIAFVMLIADFVLVRPPGLLAGFTILASEFLRARSHSLRDISFIIEWALIAAILLAIVIATRFVQVIVILDRPSLWLVFMEYFATIAIYPVVVGASRFVLGVRRIAPGEVDRTGHHI